MYGELVLGAGNKGDHNWLHKKQKGKGSQEEGMALFYITISVPGNMICTVYLAVISKFNKRLLICFVRQLVIFGQII